MSYILRSNCFKFLTLVFVLCANLQAFVSKKKLTEWSEKHPHANSLVGELESAMPGNNLESIRGIMRKAWDQGFHQFVYIAVTEDTNNAVIVAAAETISEFSRSVESAESLLLALEKSEWVRHVVMENNGYITRETKQSLERALCKVIGLDIEIRLEKRIPYEVLKSKVEEFKSRATPTPAKPLIPLSPAVSKPSPLILATPLSSDAPIEEAMLGSSMWLVTIGLFLCVAVGLIWKMRRSRK